ncbi:MAG: ABC transporter ATP-binding protein [Elusimicrobiota bacterium]
MTHHYEEEKLESRKPNIKIIARLKDYLLRYKYIFIFNLIISIIAIVTAVIEPHIIKICIDKYIIPGKLQGILFISAIFLANKFFGWALTMFEVMRTTRLGQRVLNDIRMEVFTHTQKLSMDYFDTTPQGRIIARADTDIDTMEHLMTWGAGIFLSSFLTLMGALYFMAKYNAKLCLLVSIVIPLLFVATYLFQKEGVKAYRKMRESATRITANLAENISGVKVVQSFVREEKNLAHFHQLTVDHAKNSVNSAKITSTYFPFIGIVNALGIAIIIFYGGNLVFHQQLTIGELSAYIMYLGMFFEPIQAMSELYNDLLSTGTAAERIFQLLDVKPRIVDEPKAKDLTINGKVRFENVFFRYRENKWILKDISFEASPGQTVAFVGPTGAGKTTIVNLVARFYEAQQGNIYIDDNALDNITVYSLRSQIGIVPQDSFLFSGTVLENLKYGISDITEEEVIKASKEIGLHPFIEKLNKGYKTQVKERGAGISEGERQLICITRAYISNPRILIFDEATSSIDTQTEMHIQNALEKLIKGRTCFIIAQRLSTIRKADIVLVVKDGEIIERGTHTQLLNLSGFYSKMYKEFVFNQ